MELVAIKRELLEGADGNFVVVETVHKPGATETVYELAERLMRYNSGAPALCDSVTLRWLV